MAPSGGAAPISVGARREEQDILDWRISFMTALSRLNCPRSLFPPQRAQVELEQTFVHEDVGHVVGDDLLRESLAMAVFPTPAPDQDGYSWCAGEESGPRARLVSAPITGRASSPGRAG